MSLFFQKFKHPISEIELPKKFTFPFYYEPHALCQLATKEVQEYLLSQTDFEHNFGLNPDKKGAIIGKMFGVLLVKNSAGEVGYITAVSGTLADSNTHKKFVPPVFNLLTEDSYYNAEKKALIKLNQVLENLKNSPDYKQTKAFFKAENKKGAIDINEKKALLKAGKKERDARRETGKTELTPSEFETLQNELNNESLEAKHFFNNVTRYWQHILKPIKAKIETLEVEIQELTNARKLKSKALQKYISEQYHFINANKEVKNLVELFEDNPLDNIPAGAGECAAPKLLQYAFLNHLKPLAMAEFWWGDSPNKEVRKHGQFYPACQGRCKPILTHMLSGIELDKNPLLENPAIGKELEIIFEDDTLLVINKPPDFLSVPGIYIKDSVYTRIKQTVKDISGPIVVHRLDMATSGLLLIAKNKHAHKYLQRQFINRTVKKRYTALLDGIIDAKEGTVDLPLRVDLADRPRQLVCYELGRPAVTKWKVIGYENGKTKIHFYPVSGRTHQLRVHASHILGMGTPIIGDDLYGKRANRLHLHADTISFIHPITKERIEFHQPAAF